MKRFQIYFSDKFGGLPLYTRCNEELCAKLCDGQHPDSNSAYEFTFSIGTDIIKEPLLTPADMANDVQELIYLHSAAIVLNSQRPELRWVSSDCDFSGIRIICIGNEFLYCGRR